MTDIHLHSHLGHELEPNSNVAYSYILSAIAFLILFIACVNFINLSMGLFSTRAREIGVRRVLGAMRTQLMAQIWGEAIVFSLLASIVAIALVELLLPTFNDLANKELNLSYQWQTLLAIGGLMAVVGVADGGFSGRQGRPGQSGGCAAV